MQIRDLDYEQSVQFQVMGGLAIASSGAASIAFGALTLTRTSSLVKTSTTRYAVSTGSAMALSISSPNTVPNALGVLAFGRATVSSSGTAKS
jgi:histidine ammonia-lyase